MVAQVAQYSQVAQILQGLQSFFNWPQFEGLFIEKPNGQSLDAATITGVDTLLSHRTKPLGSKGCHSCGYWEYLLSARRQFWQGVW